MPHRDSTYAAVLQRYAARFNVKPLADISLAHVLAGDTCSPIGLSDFEAYLAHKEHTLEHLQFVVWFQDYRARFLALPEEVQAASPGPKQFTFAMPNPARAAQRAAAAENHTPASPLPVLPSISEQPFCAECMRIVATFLRPGAPKELPLEPALRDTALRALARNTHPDAFLPAYEELYALIETVSLPRFLSAASANINLPKQLYWYATGAVDLLISVVIVLLVVLLVPAPPQASRAWRLFAVPFASLGSMQVYSAWRGFCSQVWGRGATQLRVWEMHEMDEEAGAHWARALDPPRSLSASLPAELALAGTEMRERTSAPVWDSRQSTLGGGGGVSMKAGSSSAGASVAMSVHFGRDADLGAIAPFGVPEDTDADTDKDNDKEKEENLVCVDSAPSLARLRIRPSALDFKACIVADSNAQCVSMPSASALADEDEEQEIEFMRPPVFGPEKVVLDPRIQAVHRRVMRDIGWAGFVWTVVFTAIVLAVPARRH